MDDDTSVGGTGESQEPEKKMSESDMRGLGAVWLAIGLGLTVWMTIAHSSGGEIAWYAIWFGPVGVIMGVLTLIWPRLALTHFNSEPGEKSLKVTSAVIYIGGIILGIVVRYTVFKDWR